LIFINVYTDLVLINHQECDGDCLMWPKPGYDLTDDQIQEAREVAEFF